MLKSNKYLHIHYSIIHYPPPYIHLISPSLSLRSPLPTHPNIYSSPTAPLHTPSHSFCLCNRSSHPHRRRRSGHRCRMLPCALVLSGRDPFSLSSWSVLAGPRLPSLAQSAPCNSPAIYSLRFVLFSSSFISPAWSQSPNPCFKSLTPTTLGPSMGRLSLDQHLYQDRLARPFPDALVNQPGKPASTNDAAQLPRGECGFILPESESPNGSRQRCSCRSFYPDSVVRSQCGCGHQAWHHESQPLSTVSIEEYVQVIEEMKKLKQEVRRYEVLEQELKQELFKERIAREEHFRTFKGIESRLYQNMQFLKISMDDRVEAVVDKTTEFSDQIKGVQERLTMVDEVTMDLENRIDRVEQLGGVSRDATPGTTTPKAPISSTQAPPVPQLPLLMQPQHSLGQLPIRTDKKYPLSWNVRVIFVPRKSQKFAYDPDSNGYRRCASRKLQQNLEFPSQDSSCFANRIDTAFKGVMRGRPWMPLSGHRPADEPFGRMALTLLPQDLIHRDVWDYPFLEDHCIAHDKMQGDVLYIALQYEDVTWNEIRFLPAVSGVDDSCWNLDEELDGTAKYRSLDSEIMYDYQDPPPTYSSRTHSLADRRTPSKLDVLADSASLLSRIQRTPTAGTTAAAGSSSSRFSSERSSLRSFRTEGTEETDDEHRDKKPKLRSKQSMPNINGSGHPQQPLYLSGRSKRKMPVREKGPKEPLHFNVAGVAKWRPNLLHPHSSKGKEAQHS